MLLSRLFWQGLTPYTRRFPPLCPWRVIVCALHVTPPSCISRITTCSFASLHLEFCHKERLSTHTAHMPIRAPNVDCRQERLVHSATHQWPRINMQVRRLVLGAVVFFEFLAIPAVHNFHALQIRSIGPRPCMAQNVFLFPDTDACGCLCFSLIRS